MRSLALALALILMTLVTPARAQGIAFTNSDPQITIGSTFTGQSITLFGNVEPGFGAIPETGPYDVIILVRGPAIHRDVRMKSRQFGVILNTDQADYPKLPGYYSVLSARPVASMLEPGAELPAGTSLLEVAARSRASGNGRRFDGEIVRLMVEAGLFQEDPRGVTFLSPTTFAAQVMLPSTTPNGFYTAEVLIVSQGEVVARSSTSFSVYAEGMESFLAESAVNQPLVYGLGAVLIALLMGWLGGVLFRR